MAVRVQARHGAGEVVLVGEVSRRQWCSSLEAAMLGKLQYAWLVPSYVLAGVGLALVMTPATTDALNTAPAALRALASGVMQTLRQVGGSVGLAIMGTAVASVPNDRLTNFANGVQPGDTGRASGFPCGGAVARCGRRQQLLAFAASSRPSGARGLGCLRWCESASA
jgi:hypothetical protein